MDKRGSSESRAVRDERREAWYFGIFRWVFLLSLLRVIAAPASEDFFDGQLVPWPSWEWPLYALVPVILIYLYRRPGDWEDIREVHSTINWALIVYSLYALAGASAMGFRVLWIAVAICAAGFVGMWHLNRKARLRDKTTEARSRPEPRRFLNPLRLYFLMKAVLVLAVLRCFVGPATKDLLGEALLPRPTWEWALCALTPLVLILLMRRADDWEALADKLLTIQIALGVYLVYGLFFAAVADVPVLWIAVAASSVGFTGVWYLNRKERLHAA